MTIDQIPNPYAPPTADIDPHGAAAISSNAVDALASRWQRFSGAFVDGIIGWVSMSPAYFSVSWAAYTGAVSQSRSAFLLYQMAGKMGIVAAVVHASFWVINWILLTKRGQTIGKMVAGTRVVRVDGGRALFVNVVALRTWPFLVLAYVPVLNRTVAPLLGFIDALFIFRSDRRCLHDLIAGTKVIRVEPQHPPDRR